MTQLVINGCSYTSDWSSTDVLGHLLGYNSVINLSQRGSSNDSIFRRTINHNLTNDVGMVILALTFWDRQEAPWADQGVWTDYSMQGIMRPHEVSDSRLYESYIRDRFKYDVSDFYIEKLLDNIIMFSGWLESQNIKYLIFPSVSVLPKNPKGISQAKLDYIKQNPNIIDLNWSANRYIFENGGTWIETDDTLLEEYRHPDKKSYKILNTFILDYLKIGK